MKVTLERSALLKSLGHVHRVVERRTTIPILSNVLLSAGGGGLQLKATDLDLEVTETVPADVGQAGATTLPAHTLYEIVRKLPDGAQVSLETASDDGQLQLRSGRSRFSLQSLPESDFPDLAAGELSHQFKLRRGRSAAPDRQDAIRHLQRRNPLLPQWRVLHVVRGRRQAGAARGGDRRPPAGAARDAGPGGRGRHAGRHRAAQGGRRSAEADRRPRGRSRSRAFARRKSASPSARWC